MILNGTKCNRQSHADCMHLQEIYVIEIYFLTILCFEKKYFFYNGLIFTLKKSHLLTVKVYYYKNTYYFLNNLSSCKYQHNIFNQYFSLNICLTVVHSRLCNKRIVWIVGDESRARSKWIRIRFEAHKILSDLNVLIRHGV
jgi:hypothetical protein